MSRFPEMALAALLVAGVPMTAEAGDKLGLGREATADEVKAWTLGSRPDGQTLPPGKGTVKQGEEIFQAQCATCHGEFGEGRDRWPELAGGHGSLQADRPTKTIGSFWPEASTVFDYIARAMPFGNAQSLTNDQIYALTAYILNLNDVVKDQDFELNQQNLASIKMPNKDGFYDDDREVVEKQFWGAKPCMKDCKAEVHVTGRAQVLDVTPDSKTGPKVE